MKLQLIPITALAFLMVACQNTPEDFADQSFGGSGGANGSVDGTINASEADALAGSELGQSVLAGSAEDFDINVGDRVFFGFDSAVLDDDARETLDRQAAWLQQYPSVTVTIEGHTDERGTREFNLALGERRAVAARNYLVALGIDADRVLTISYGEERPVDPAHDENAWAQNRRAVTVVNVIN